MRAKNIPPSAAQSRRNNIESPLSKGAKCVRKPAVWSAMQDIGVTNVSSTISHFLIVSRIRLRLQGCKGSQYNPAMLFQNRKIGFIGAGNMTEALIAGLLHDKQLSPLFLIASDVDAFRCECIRARFGINTTIHNREAAADANVLVLAVEPQHLDEVLLELAGGIRDTTLVVSVAAGYPI